LLEGAVAEHQLAIRDAQAGVGDTVGGQMLAGRAAIFGFLRILRHFAKGDFGSAPRPASADRTRSPQRSCR
jgi:hypothetical protein